MLSSRLKLLVLFAGIILAVPVAQAQICALDGMGCATVPAPSCTGGCGPSGNRFLSHSNFFYGPELGGFDLNGTDFATACCDPLAACGSPGVIPPLRYWAYDQFSGGNAHDTLGANNGCQPLFIPPPVNDCYIAEGVSDIGLGIPPGIWLLYQAQWSSATGSGISRIDGCITTATNAVPVPPDTSLRNVAEMSWADSTTNEGFADHSAYYLIAAVAEAGGQFPFDNLTGGNLTRDPGSAAATIRPQAVPDILTLSNPTGIPTSVVCQNGMGAIELPSSATAPGFGELTVEVNFTDPEWLTEAGLNGAPALIAGLQVVFTSGGAPPTTSDPSIYVPALNTVNPGTDAAGIIPWGGPTSFTVSVPMVGGPHYAAVRIIYTDSAVNGQISGGAIATAPRLGSWTGMSCGPITVTGLAVTFDTVTATETPDGVRVDWSTVMEDDVLGFTVHRATNPQGTGSVEASVPWIDSVGAGNPYSVVDSAVAGDTIPYFYYVREFTSAGPGDKSWVVPVRKMAGDGFTGGRDRSSRRNR